MQEKTGPFKGTGVWKLPTGVVEEVRVCNLFSLLLQQNRLYRTQNVSTALCNQTVVHPM